LLFAIVGIVFALWLTNADAARTSRTDAETILNALSAESLLVEGHIEEVYLPQAVQMREQGYLDIYILEEYRTQPLVPIITYSIALRIVNWSLQTFDLQSMPH